MGFILHPWQLLLVILAGWIIKFAALQQREALGLFPSQTYVAGVVFAARPTFWLVALTSGIEKLSNAPVGGKP
jgi:hypothetical protein